MGGYLFPRRSSWYESISRFPSTQNFFYDLFRIRATKLSRERYVNVLGLTYGGVNELIARAWGLTRNLDAFDKDEWLGVNVEDVFTFLDIGEKTYNAGTDYYMAFRKSKEFLEDFICLMLGVRSNDVHCEFLIQLLSRLDSTDTVISFNWDTIADKSLFIAEAPQYNRYADMLSGQPVSVRASTEAGQFLKLHGSLNWLLCENPQCQLHSSPVIPFADDRREPPPLFSAGRFDRCPACGTERPRRLIVPPTSNKLIQKSSLLHKLWLVARERLAHTSELIFIGYSFPITDSYSEWLFRQFRFVDLPNPTIVVVNPDMYKPESRTAKRYAEIFRGCEIHRYRNLRAYVDRVVRRA
jgi:hypothetical protein